MYVYIYIFFFENTNIEAIGLASALIKKEFKFFNTRFSLFNGDNLLL